MKFLRYVHRLEPETSGVLLFAKSPGAIETFSDLFESRRMEKTYLAVVVGEPKQTERTCHFKLAPDSRQIGRMKAEAGDGKEAETHFKALKQRGVLSLVEAKPITGRTHQLRVHLAESGLPIVGDELYCKEVSGTPPGLRAVRLAYVDPFTKRRADIHAPTEAFLTEFGFGVRSRVTAFKAPTCRRIPN